ncbi:MAG: DUF1127 domain-containing protein [Methylobacterium sp.]|uniref:DUF1127 domain-containing protein n=1 Tax=Methylobacterium sp. TaxID=409 RepID=UPI0025885DFA|nr:DUF1127 domain-containing protein [Methylobacterium sp.]MBY0294694.1 DUF1127 domain-containing protein [Methylobacterium sp.]
MTIGFAPFGVLSLVLRAGRATGRIVVQAIRLWQNRRAAHRLADLDDRMLKDLGLTRTEVVGALALSWRDDPTLHLAGRRGLKARRGSPHGVVRIVASDGRRLEGTLAC